MCPVELIGIYLCLFQEHPLLISKNKRIDKRLGNAEIHQKSSLLWRHNGREGVSNHQPHECLLNRSFMRRSKKTSKLRVTGLCAGNSPETGEFPAQMASNAENVSIWWRHHANAHRSFDVWVIVFYKSIDLQSLHIARDIMHRGVRLDISYHSIIKEHCETVMLF